MKTILTSSIGAWLTIAGAICLAGCGDVIVEGRGDASGGSGSGSGGMTGGGGNGNGSGSGSGSGSGNGVCAPGDHPVTFGQSDSPTLGIAADSNGVYWASGGAIWKAAPGGGSPEVLAKGLGQLDSVAIDSTYVYSDDYAAGLWAVPRAGGPAKLLAKAPVVSVATGPGGVYFAASEGVFHAVEGAAPVLLAKMEGASSLAADAGWVYVKSLGPAGNSTTQIARVPVAGGPAEVIAPPEPQSYSYFFQELAVDESSVYWLNASAGTVMKAPKTGGAPVILAKGIADPVSIVASGGFVYFTVRGKDGGSFDERAVARIPVAGGDLTFIAHGPQVSAFGLAVDDTTAYWTAKVTSGWVSAACR